MAIIAAPMALRIASHSPYPVSETILMVIVLIAALAAAGQFIGRRYVKKRLSQRSLDALPPVDQLGNAISARLSRATSRWFGPVR